MRATHTLKKLPQIAPQIAATPTAQGDERNSTSSTIYVCRIRPPNANCARPVMPPVLNTSSYMGRNRQPEEASTHRVQSMGIATTQQAQLPCGCDAAATNAAATTDEDQLFSRQVTRLVHDHRTQLARVARHEGLSAEDAFDAVQEAFSAFLVLPRSRALVDTPEEARRFLSAITRNIARNARRLHATARPHVTEPAVVEGMADERPAPDEGLSRAESNQRLARCVGRLAEVQRAVITLRMLDELPGEDVARVLGISPGHVAVLLHRAKASLLTCLTQ